MADTESVRVLGLRNTQPVRQPARPPLLREAMPSSEYYPVEIDVERRVFTFVKITRETYRSAAFLVPRHTNMGTRMFTFNMDDLVLANSIDPVYCSPIHYVLISAFCCSTLLSRYLDQMSRCLVLKEPALIAQLGFLRYRRTDGTKMPQGVEWKQVANLGLTLMSRAFSLDDTVVVKPSDIGNCIAPELLDHDFRSRALLLSVPLRTFILSVLKSESRREWTRKRASFWHRTLTEWPALTRVNPRSLNDAQKSAYIWIVTSTLWSKLLRGDNSHRIMIVNGEEISNNTVQAMGKILTFFNIAFTEDDLMRIAGSQSSSRHAKRPGIKYDSEMRQSDLVKWESQYGEETDRAIEWAETLAAELNLGRLDGVVAGFGPESFVINPVLAS